MIEYSIPLSCPRCGYLLEEIATGVQTSTEVSAIARCTNIHCHYEWQVMVRLVAVGKLREDRRQPCGTTAGYRAHLRRGEEPDAACAEAWCRDRTDRNTAHGRKSRAKAKVDA